MGVETTIFNGMVSHVRFFPKKHKFNYRVFSMLFEIDKLEEIEKSSRLFSYNKFNLFSFFNKDHGEKDGTNPRNWIQKIAKKAGVEIKNTKIFCLCYPRVLGYVFNPISVWFVYNKDNLKMLIYEVRNTFGEDHSYVFKLGGESTNFNHKSEKLLHVSPFISMNGGYQFSTNLEKKNVSIVIKEISDKKHLLTASFVGKGSAFNDANLFLNFILYPLLTIKVIYGIHFQALILWLKDIRYVKHKKSNLDKVSYNRKYSKKNDRKNI